MRKNKSVTLRTLTTSQIAAELRRRKAHALRLKKKRDALIARVARLEKKIARYAKA